MFLSVSLRHVLCLSLSPLWILSVSVSVSRLSASFLSFFFLPDIKGQKRNLACLNWPGLGQGAAHTGQMWRSVVSHFTKRNFSLGRTESESEMSNYLYIQSDKRWSECMKPGEQPRHWKDNLTNPELGALIPGPRKLGFWGNWTMTERRKMVFWRELS